MNAIEAAPDVLERRRIHWVWAEIIQRCTNPRNKSYKRYGGRGISVCDRWRNSFELFCKDMGPRPLGSMIDRIDNNAWYSPDNCRWVTPAQSNSNRSISRLVTVDGENMCLKHACKKLGLLYRPIAKRFQRGWPEYRALYEPLNKKKTHGGSNDSAI